MKRLLTALLAIAATASLAGPNDSDHSSGTIATSGVWTVLTPALSGPVKQVDVYLSNTSAVSVDIVASTTNGSRVGKTVLSSGSITASRSYPVATRRVNTSGVTFTNDVPADIWLSEDRLRITVSNKNAAVTTSAKVTIIRGGE